jgi:hypothetical protein
MVLNAPAMAVLVELPRIDIYVIAGVCRQQGGNARADVKRPWAAVRKRTGHDVVRLHDLQRTHASFGAAGGLGLPVIGKLCDTNRSRRPRAVPSRHRPAAARPC